MATTGPRLKSKQQHRLDAQRELLIDQMAAAMRSADGWYLGEYRHMTYKMVYAISCFYDWCGDNYLEKA